MTDAEFKTAIEAARAKEKNSMTTQSLAYTAARDADETFMAARHARDLAFAISARRIYGKT